MRKVVPLLVAAVSSLFSLTSVIAQPVASGSGTDFVVSVLPSTRSIGDSLYIALFSSNLASGTVKYTTVNGQNISRNFRIIDARRITYVGINRTDVEVHGAVIDGKYLPGDQAEEVHSTQLISIHADSAVSAALVAGDISSNAVTSLLPLSVLGRSYIVATYPASVVKSATNDIDWSKSAPSQFVVIATQDNTVLTIGLHGRTSHESTGEKKVILNAGQWYFVQSVIDLSADLSDLSGTRITADRPVACFAGHQNAAVPAPTEMLDANAQRGYMMQQMTPIERWGSEYVVVPLAVEDNGVKTGPEFVRLFSAVPKTRIFVDDKETVTLNEGEFFDLTMSEPHAVRASNPISVVQYSTTANAQQPQVFGNASMLCLSSRQQWKKEHSISAVQSKFNFTKVFPSQYIVVVAPSDGLTSLVFDGEPTTSDLIKIGETGYSYLIRKVSDGVHSVSCDKECEVLMYGLGNSHRYGYCPDANYPVHAYMYAAMHIPDVVGEIGQTVDLSVYIDSLILPPEILGLHPTRYSFDLCFNSTMMTPVDEQQRGVIENGVQRIHQSGELSHLDGSTKLMSLSMICGLGDAEESPIVVNNLLWFTDNGDTIALEYPPVQGWLHISNVWHDPEGPRLVNPQPGDLSVEVSPNPLHGRAFITCSSSIQTSLTPSLVLYNSMGEALRDFSAEMSGFSRASRVMFESENIQPGVYYLRFSIGEKSAVMVVVIV